MHPASSSATSADSLRWFGWRKAAGVTIATILALNFTVVLGLQTGQWDAADYFAPFFSLVGNAARQGEIVQ